MKLKQLLFALLVGWSSNSYSTEQVLFEDHFMNKNEVDWTWKMLNSATFELNGTGLKQILPIIEDEKYHDSSIYTDILYENVIGSFWIRSDKLEAGSRGWGFWNRGDAVTSNMAWFIYLRGESNYQLNGFYAFSQSAGKELEITKLSEAPLASWNYYQISLSDDEAKFYIDGKQVAIHKRSVPNDLMAVHVWVDNAVYDPESYQMIPLQTRNNTQLDINQVRVLENSLQ